MIPVDARVEAEMLGDLLIARPLEHSRAAADQDRHFGPVYVKVIEQVLHVSVTVKVEIREGVAVTGEEFLDAKRRRGSAGPDEQRIADPLRHQRDPSMEQ